MFYKSKGETKRFGKKTTGLYLLAQLQTDSINT